MPELGDRRWYLLACSSLIAVILFMLLRELMLAPVRPGGSWLALKTIPLALALFGILKGRIYTYQWASLLIWVYIAFAVVSGITDPRAASRTAGWVEAGLCALFFVAAVAYVRPFKKAHKARLRAASDVDQAANVQRNSP